MQLNIHFALFKRELVLAALVKDEHSSVKMMTNNLGENCQQKNLICIKNLYVLTEWNNFCFSPKRNYFSRKRHTSTHFYSFGPKTAPF